MKVSVTRPRLNKISVSSIRIRNGKSGARTANVYRHRKVSLPLASPNNNQCIIPLMQYYTVRFVYFLALHCECKIRLEQVSRWRMYVHACLRPGKHTYSRCTSKININQHVQRCAVSSRRIYSFVVGRACLLLSYDYARAIVKALSAGRWDVGSLAPLCLARIKHRPRWYRQRDITQLSKRSLSRPQIIA